MGWLLPPTRIPPKETKALGTRPVHPSLPQTSHKQKGNSMQKCAVCQQSIPPHSLTAKQKIQMHASSWMVTLPFLQFFWPHGIVFRWATMSIFPTLVLINAEGKENSSGLATSYRGRWPNLHAVREPRHVIPLSGFFLLVDPTAVRPHNIMLCILQGGKCHVSVYRCHASALVVTPGKKYLHIFYIRFFSVSTSAEVKIPIPTPLLLGEGR